MFKKLFPFLHTVLFAFFSPLFFYANNVSEVFFRETLATIGAVLGLAALFSAIFLAFYRDKEKATVAASFALILFFSYGHIFTIRGDDYWIRNRYLVSIYALTFILGTVTLFFTRRSLRHWINALTLVAIVLLASPLASIASFQWLSWNSKAQIAAESPGRGDGPLPDIYYIVPDAYTSAVALKQFYDFDNSEFIKTLEKRGFFVSPTPLSNHSGTMMSLATVLNLDYLQNLSPTGEVTRETIDLRTLVRDNTVVKFLQDRGYAYVHMGSWSERTYFNPHADRNVNTKQVSQFFEKLYNTTIAYPFTYSWFSFETARLEWERIKVQLDELMQIPSRSGPYEVFQERLVFTFVHFGIPRGPFVFHADGTFQEPEEEYNDPVRAAQGLKGEYHVRGYVNQVRYLNERLVALVDTILAESKMPPIIIIQSDHGSRVTIKKRTEGPELVSDFYIQDRMRNFSAYYLPNGGNASLYNTMTPVNIFRIVFNHYFGTKYKLLPDRAYVSLPRPDNQDEDQDAGELYFLLDVTDRAKYER